MTETQLEKGTLLNIIYLSLKGLWEEFVSFCTIENLIVFSV